MASSSPELRVVLQRSQSHQTTSKMASVEVHSMPDPARLRRAGRSWLRRKRREEPAIDTSSLDDRHAARRRR